MTNKEILKHNNGFYILDDLNMYQVDNRMPPSFPPSNNFVGDHNEYFLSPVVLSEQYFKNSSGIHNMLVTDKKHEIIESIKEINKTFSKSTRNFISLMKHAFADPLSTRSLITLPSKTYLLALNYGSSKLMNNNFYAFSYD